MNLKFDNKININYKNNSKQKIILFQINIKTIKSHAKVSYIQIYLNVRQTTDYIKKHDNVSLIKKAFVKDSIHSVIIFIFVRLTLLC